MRVKMDGPNGMVGTQELPMSNDWIRLVDTGTERMQSETPLPAATVDSVELKDRSVESASQPPSNPQSAAKRKRNLESLASAAPSAAPSTSLFYANSAEPADISPAPKEILPSVELPKLAAQNVETPALPASANVNAATSQSPAPPTSLDIETRQRIHALETTVASLVQQVIELQKTCQWLEREKADKVRGTPKEKENASAPVQSDSPIDLNLFKLIAEEEEEEGAKKPKENGEAELEKEVVTGAGIAMEIDEEEPARQIPKPAAAAVDKHPTPKTNETPKPSTQLLPRQFVSQPSSASSKPPSAPLIYTTRRSTPLVSKPVAAATAKSASSTTPNGIKPSEHLRQPNFLRQPNLPLPLNLPPHTQCSPKSYGLPKKLHQSNPKAPTNPSAPF